MNVADGENRWSLAVLVLEKVDCEGTPHAWSIDFFESEKIFELRIFSWEKVWLCYFFTVTTNCVLLHLFSVEKVQFLGQKLQGRHFLAFLTLFLVRPRALRV